MSHGWRKRLRALLFAVGVVAISSACNEDLDGGAACPSLCPGQNVIVSDTVLEAITFDTVVAGVQGVGSQGALLLTTRGDTLETRVVLRFDSLPSRVTWNGGDSAITAVDSAYLLLRLNTGRTKVKAPVRIDLYDVDTTAADTSTAAIVALFRPDRLLGGSTLDTNQVKDSLRVYFTNAKLLPKVTGKQRLRVGLRISGDSSAVLSVGAYDGGMASFLKFDPVPQDTAVDEVTVGLRSDTPTDNVELQTDLLDFFVVAKGAPTPAEDILTIGGLPASRSYLRFDVPVRILDSSTVLRATLLLHQVPNRYVDKGDSVLILPQVVLAGQEVTDFSRSAGLLSPFPVDTVRLAPGDSGVKQIEVAAALRQWSSTTNPFKQQRALVIRSNDEGLGPFEAHFFSLRSANALRPRLRVSYSLRTTFGIP